MPFRRLLALLLWMLLVLVPLSSGRLGAAALRVLRVLIACRPLVLVQTQQLAAGASARKVI